jgi:hypothetical protein
MGSSLHREAMVRSQMNARTHISGSPPAAPSAFTSPQPAAAATDWQV